MIETGRVLSVASSTELPDESQTAEPRTLSELFLHAAAEHDLADALNHKRDDQWLTISSREIVERAENIALGLYSLGLRKGDRAAILAANSPEWTLADAGCQFAGVIDVPIYTTLSPDAIRYILCDSDARVLFVGSKDLYSHVDPVLADCPSLERVVFFAGSSIGNGMSLAQLEALGGEVAQSMPDLAKTLRDSVEPGDIATLIYTSGTTGQPKGVMLTHINLISNALDASERYEFSGERDTAISVLPLSHVFERTGMYVYIHHGMRVFYAESIEKAPDNLKEVRPTVFIGVPRIFEKVFERARLKAAQGGRLKAKIFDWAVEVAKEFAACQARGNEPSMLLAAKHSLADKLVYRKFRDLFGGRLRYCITGGAALPDEFYLVFTGAGVTIMQGYGLTETSPVISSNNPAAARLGTVGKPIRNVHVRIADDGEIEVTGPGVMRGYYHKDEETEAAFTGDGWFRTGDLGRLDDDGFLIITDRKKELFKTSGGKYIAPSPIEQMLRSSRFVNQAVLVGNERKFPAALIVPNFDMLASYARLKGLGITTTKEFCTHPKIIDLFTRQLEGTNAGLSQYEKIKKFALLESELTVENGELTPTLKIKRRAVDEKYCDVIDELYR